jgi:electron transport complex protein RnfB
MSDEVYARLADVLNTLPNGFPRTEQGLEIKLLKKIFAPDEADLFCDLRLTWETAEQISQRAGRPLEGLEDRLKRMSERGLIQGVALGPSMIFRMMPWAFGIYEMQNRRMDREMAQLAYDYWPHYLKGYQTQKPQGFQVIPVERNLPSRQEAMPYQQVSRLIENSKSFVVMDCICKKEKGLLGQACKHPLEVCMGFAPIPGAFDRSTTGRAISKEEALEILARCEEAGLVHITDNVQTGHFYLCNCCGCCCGVLQGINRVGLAAGLAVNSRYYAVIDPDLCTACGTCAEERCQVRAIEERDTFYEILPERCIGCGLCVSTCPSQAIALVPKRPQDFETPPVDQQAWFDQRGRARGVDYSRYR